MLEQIDLQQVLVLDIETVSQKALFAELPDHFQELWAYKVKKSLQENETAADVYSNAGLHPEFGKIICISVGAFHQRQGQMGFRVKSFVQDDERELLADFARLLQKQPPSLTLCGHNGKGFDFPYICKRMLINGLAIPAQFDISGKKPWEINHLDTMELWRFGDYRNNVSLNLMAAVLGIPTPKDDISGEDVYHVYYEENNLERIRVYCEKDVITTAQILRKLRSETLIASDNISFADE
ncbi:3'-5' exonuclease [Parapedobacter tibetensis]|uniref:3'-5' exonuclease n=1 Tax=Parapedobacter tibetensis TaxID=2972951 RepID=UPI00214DDFB0|nr:3'-5' exonuclease [Parapedobacter tibetensis]